MKFLTSTILIIFSGTAAFAGGMTEPETSPAPTPPAPAPAAMDWTGGYVGLSFGGVTGDIDFNPAPARAMDDGTAAALYGGYMVQRGNLVFGGELALNSVNDTAVTGFVGTSEVTDMTDLKGRLGYASGSFLVYGILGYSFGTYNDLIGTPGNKWDIDGLNYGVGVDYALTNNWILGAEYLLRDVDGDNPAGGGQTVDIDYDSFSIRATYKF